MIEYIEELTAKLCGEFFVDLLSLAHRCIQVPIAGTVEQTLGHGSERAYRRRCYRGTALRPATVRREGR